jgi:serine/threonine protein kinase
MVGPFVDGREVVRRLGAGGMGEVYLVRDHDGQTRAVKVVRADQQTARNAAGRFRREALALGKLRHPGIVQIVDAGALQTGELYLAMEYVPGADLQAMVTGDGPLSVSGALALLTQLAGALAYAHAAGVVHRDLKPPNVLLADNNPARAKIIDFGLAKLVSDEGLTRLTEDQQVVGSPLYWAPEQSKSAAVGPAADVYALAGIAYFALSGHPLFRPRPAVALVYAHIHQQPEPLATRCPNIALPAGFDALIAACAAKDPASRPTTTRVAEELEQMLASLPADSGRHRARRLFTTTGASELEQALTAQLRNVLLDVAAAVTRPTDAIDRLTSALSELELELAMLDSEVDAGEADKRATLRHEQVAASVAELERSLADAFRSLYDDVVAHRDGAPADAQSLYGELDALVARLGA